MLFSSKHLLFKFFVSSQLTGNHKITSIKENKTYTPYQ